MRVSIRSNDVVWDKVKVSKRDVKSVESWDLRPVCKAWNNLILSRQFDPISKAIFAYISPPHHYPNKLHCIDFDFDFDFDFDSKPLKEGKSCIVASFTFHPHFSTIEIINSCNGLLCFVDRSNNVLGGENMKARVFILNPMTNEYTQVPSHDYGGATDSYGYGFGFSPNTKQYKIVRLPRATMTPAAILFVGGCGKWTSVTIPSIYALSRNHGIYFNGGLYWRGYHFVVPRFHTRRFILRFDLENEKFEEISLPQIEEQNFHSDDFGFQFFNGSLYASNFNDESCRKRYRIKLVTNSARLLEYTDILHSKLLGQLLIDPRTTKLAEDIKEVMAQLSNDIETLNKCMKNLVLASGRTKATLDSKSAANP
ncbi:unnamed protein product [Citrullus colocynthis]|uniref:F-box associated beta-propeller type 3 domain-containing protein n=1 Tax=Citrullus colocynthis TaxID=252529 RepID=A0ABP0YL79_9ROSI